MLLKPCCYLAEITNLPCCQCSVCNAGPYQEERAVDPDPKPRVVDQRVVLCVEHLRISSRIYRRPGAVVVSEYAKKSCEVPLWSLKNFLSKDANDA